MKGKIAVINGCQWCPYKAIDSGLGPMEYDIVYCGYHKIGYDDTQTRIENTIIFETSGGAVIPDDFIDRPDDCPLPDGDDGRVY